MNNIDKTINKIYEKKLTFTGRYGSDLVIALIIVYIFLVGITYYHVLNHLPDIKANWPKNKCNPLYLPFAGIIVDDKKKSNLNLIGENFEACVQNILTSISADAFKPIYYVMNTLTSGFKEMTHASSAIRSFFNKMRVDMKDTSENISGRTLNITIPFTEQMIYFKNMLSQFVGSLVASIYTLFGGYLTLQSLIGAIIDLVKIILELVAAAIVAAQLIPFVGELIAAPIIGFEVAILILFLPVLFAFNSVFHEDVSPPSMCFGKETKIEMSDNSNKNISDIKIGDILFDNSVVTATMKLSSYGQSIYNLNGIIVTGLHRIYHETSGWIKVADHPQSYLVNDYRENILYCLNTDTKTIKIGNQTFSDWDDLDDKDLTQINRSKTLTKFINNQDVHPYLDNGFEENTMIELEIGNIVKIKDLEINDVLRFGERVLGIIKINASDIVSINEYYFDDTHFICTKNIQIFNENIGNFTTDNLEGNKIIIDDYLYQIVTDKGSFHIGNIKVSDYNFGIEKYLDNIFFYQQNLYQ
tara:strand:- start:1365 stop:2948 length:1584 start_codon:yes stop_codon:yes gene_type:complete